jgi:hypothetical protein
MLRCPLPAVLPAQLPAALPAAPCGHPAMPPPPPATHLQGYTYADFLNEIPEDPQNQIFALSSIDKAMVVACELLAQLQCDR